MESDKEILQNVEAEDDEQRDNLKNGAQQDVIDMRRLGKPQELRWNFKALSILGLATVTMATWVAMITNSLFSLINGGLAGTIWVYLGSWLLTICLVSSLAEMVSRSDVCWTHAMLMQVVCRPQWLRQVADSIVGSFRQILLSLFR